MRTGRAHSSRDWGLPGGHRSLGRTGGTEQGASSHPERIRDVPGRKAKSESFPSSRDSQQAMGSRGHKCRDVVSVCRFQMWGDAGQGHWLGCCPRRTGRSRPCPRGAAGGLRTGLGVRAEATQARRLAQIGLPKTSAGPTCEPRRSATVRQTGLTG